MLKKTITLKVPEEYAEEFHGALNDWIENFYGEEKDKVEVGEIQDAG